MEIKTSSVLIDYEEAVTFMENRVADIREGKADECLWFLEHPSLYTAGSSAKDKDLLNAQFPVYKTGRGGQYTYHGPGQRVVYVMLDLKKRQSQPDLKQFICSLEEWIIQSLKELGIDSFRRQGRVGIWVKDEQSPGGESKIAAIGVRVRHWVTYHGIAINVNPDLSHFNGIVPCGLPEFGVTSIDKFLGQKTSMKELDKILIERATKQLT